MWGETNLVMELYYKDLISKEASLEKLVDDLMLVVQGAEEYAQAAGVDLPGHKKEEIRSRLERLKDGCRRIAEHTQATAKAADKVVRRYPYSSLVSAFVFGLLIGKILDRRS